MRAKYNALGKIIELAHKISVERKADVFVDYSGHVQLLAVRLYFEGWAKDRDVDCMKSVYLDGSCGKMLTEILTLLESIYANEPPVLESGECSLCKCKLYTNDIFTKFKGGKICDDCVAELKNE